MSKDTIYRRDAIDAITTEGTRLERNGTVAMVEIKHWCVDLLEALPSADRPTGEWVFDTQIPIGKGAYSAGYRCSICGRDYFRVDGMNFCGNCGARMRPKLQGTHFDSIIIDECAMKGVDDETD